MRQAVKRFIDIVVALAGLVALSPLLFAVSIMILLFMGRPVIFRQERPGLQGRVFPLLKFRTMTDATDDQGKLLPDSERLTRLGRFLRRTSMDELPQLWNVLRGELSLVGPRPLLVHYMELYSPEQMRRHQVKPGITGWAQVNGRNDITWEEKFLLDVWYVDNRSLFLDLRILAMTLVKVVKGEGVSQTGHATAEPFGGTPGEPGPTLADTIPADAAKSPEETY
jgi:sugar transferase EpsL